MAARFRTLRRHAATAYDDHHYLDAFVHIVYLDYFHFDDNIHVDNDHHNDAAELP